jgi:hypothetical protein
MIALIKFVKSPLIIKRSEADQLGIRCEETARGFCLKDNELCVKESYHKIRDIECKLTDNGSYVTANNEIVASYWLVDEVDESVDMSNTVLVTGSHLVDLLKFAPLCKFPYSILECVQPSTAPDILQELLFTVESKVERLVATISNVNKDFNTKCDVHVGGGLIATFNEVCLKEDTCTDALQTTLTDGWRIIAVCVQPDQRRPDYILGRYNPSLNIDLGAKR